MADLEASRHFFEIGKAAWKVKAQVYLLQSTRDFDVAYTYRIDASLERAVRPGCFVSVPFGRQNRLQTALVWELEAEEEEVEKPGRLKSVAKILTDWPCLTKAERDLCKALRDRYFCTMGEVLRCFLPPEGGKGKPVKCVRPAGTREIFQEACQKGVLRSIQQIQVLEYYLREEEDWLCWRSVRDLCSRSGLSDSAVQSLVRKGYLMQDKQVVAEALSAQTASLPSQERPLLLPEQQEACNRLEALLETGTFQEALIQGVTGSGKTEVYLHLIERVLTHGGKAVMLVPEISLTPQMTERFQTRFGAQLAVLHSRLSDGERNRTWQRLHRGEASVLLGVRSAVFAPFDRISLFILDEEQEPSYKSEDMAPRYHAAEVAQLRARRDGALVVYGSATPRLETAYRAKQGEILDVRLTKRANQGALPDVHVVDMRKEWEDGFRGLFSRALVREMTENVRRGEQTILFVNRRGYAKQVLCRSCGAGMKCGKCNIAMTYHEKSHRLICHYCGNTVPLPSRCLKCGSVEYERRGCGTEQVEAALHELFPDCSVVRMDADTTGGREGHQRQLDRFRQEKVPFLVGTQMVAKGHDFPLVTLVGVLAADNLLAVQDYRAEERAFQLLTQVAGRAGRRDLPGRVLIQAFDVDDYAICTAAEQDYETFYQNEIAIRQKLWYPPFCSMGKLLLQGPEDRLVYEWGCRARHRLQVLLESTGASVEMLGPTRDALPKCNGRYRWQLILKAPALEPLHELLRAFLSEPEGRRKKDYRIAVDIG